MSELFSVQIDNYPYAFASVFEKIDAYVGWRMMTRTDYSESSEIYIVFNFEEEEILISDKPYGNEISDLDEFLNSFFDNEDEEEYHERQWKETGDAKHLTSLIRLDCERTNDEKRKENKSRW